MATAGDSVSISLPPVEEHGPMTREEKLKEAIEKSNLNALRISLFQCTGNKELADMTVEAEAIRGGAQIIWKVAAKDVPRLKELAFDYLSKRSEDEAWPAYPSKEESRKLMDMYRPTEDPTADETFQYDYDELAFEAYPREAHWTNDVRPPAEKLSKWKVAIIGAGIGGVAAAVQLEHLGIPYVVIDRQSEPGGTWLWNTYPDCRVDTPAYLFQFKFEKNYPWTEYFPSSLETRRYLQYILKKYNVPASKFIFERSVVKADWHENESKWEVVMNDKQGKSESLKVNAIISCTGLFATPNEPSFPGRETFKGHSFHSTGWDHSVSHDGKRVAVIGNGSTGTQLAPKVAQTAKSVTIFQRTPHWVMAVPQYKEKHTEVSRLLFKELPFYWHWFCYAVHCTAQQTQRLQDRDDEWIKQGGQFNKPNDAARKAITEYIRGKVGHNPELFKKVVPTAPPYAKRLVVDNGFFDMLNQPQNELVDTPIERFTENGIMTKDGKEREFDIIVLACGFQVTRYFYPTKYVGRNGRTFDKEWEKDGARSYLGMVNPGFPNFFSYYGPNHQPRSGGYYSWAEVWGRWTQELLIHMIENDKSSVEIKQEVYDAHQEVVDRNAEDLLWALKSGVSYYQNSAGRSAIQAPFTTYWLYKALEHPKLDEFNIK